MTTARIIQRVVFAVIAMSASDARSASPAAQSEILGPTVHRYLASGGSYTRGDLIARSQVEELQMYLRKTQGHSLATHSKWRQHVLPDNAPLVKMFYSGGRKVLKQLAVKLGGYADLDRLSHTAKGRELLRKAIQQGSIEAVIAYLEREKVAGKAAAQKKMSARVFQTRIYTADKFLAEIASARLAKAATAAEQELTARETPNR